MENQIFSIVEEGRKRVSRLVVGPGSHSHTAHPEVGPVPRVAPLPEGERLLVTLFSRASTMLQLWLVVEGSSEEGYETSCKPGIPVAGIPGEMIRRWEFSNFEGNCEMRG